MYGSPIIVEVDESTLFKRKYNRGENRMELGISEVSSVVVEGAL